MGYFPRQKRLAVSQRSPPESQSNLDEERRRRQSHARHGIVVGRPTVTSRAGRPVQFDVDLKRLKCDLLGR